MSKNANPMKVIITGPDTRWSYAKCVGSKIN